MDKNDERRRWLVASVIAVNCLLYVLTLCVAGLQQKWVLLSTSIFAEKVAGLFTYSFVHSGFLHLLFNMLILWVLGNLLVKYSGWVQFVAVYFCGAMAGGIGFLLYTGLSPAVPGLLCGASASVLGIAGGLSPQIWCKKVTLQKILNIAGVKNGNKFVISFKGKYFLAGILLLTVVANPFPAAIVTHLCGFAGGVVAAYLLNIIQRLYCHIGKSSQNEIFESREMQQSTSMRQDVLEKVERSGYESLTQAERRQLM